MYYNVNTVLQKLLRPYVLIVVTTFFSFCAWLFPDIGGIRKGIEYHYDISLSGIFICSLWLLNIICLSFVGYKVGSHIGISNKGLKGKVGLNNVRPYIIMTGIGLIGLAYVLLLVIQRAGFSPLLTAITSGQANYVKDTLYSDYSVGLPSLRCIIIPAAALAIYHLINRRYVLLSLINIVALGCLSLISSRLSIIYCNFITIPLLASSGNIKIRRRWLFLGSIGLFLILSALNWSRNRSFYIEYYNQHNWLIAGFSEIITYLGSPFQDFIASGSLGNIIYNKTELELPSYTGIDYGLNTNSALSQLIVQMGLLQAFIVISFEVLLASIVCGICSKNMDSYLGIIYGVLIYCFAEQWRVHLFNQGIVITIITVTSGLYILFRFFPQIKFAWQRKSKI